MTRDRNLLKRDLMVIPGALLAVYGLVGLLYVLFWRDETGPCVATYRLLVGGACYNVLPLLLLVLLVGLALLLIGTLVFRGRVETLEGHLHAGTPTHVFLAFLLSLVVIPGVAALAMRYLERAQGTLYATTLAGTPVKTVALFAALAVVGFLVLLPYAILLGRQVARRRRFLAEARRIAPPVPGEERPRGGSTPPPAPGAPLTDEGDWPESR
jgi:hypothetical protein